MAGDQDFLPPEVRAYLARSLPVPYPAMARLEREVAEESQPAVGRQTGGVLRALALARGARRVLEVGTNLGYSGLWLCAGLAPDGRFEGIEINEEIAARATAHLREAVGERATVHVGAALDVLPRLPDASYDLVFLDAVKSEYPRYLDHAMRLLKPGGIVAADNLFWLGQAWDEDAQDEDTLGVREYTRRILTDARLASTIVPVEDGLGVSVRLP